MLHFRQCAPPPTGVRPQASHGLDKSTTSTTIKVYSTHAIHKESVETTLRNRGDVDKSEKKVEFQIGCSSF